MPILLAAIYFAARQTNEKFPLLPNSRLCAGLIALTLMLSAELAVATSFRGLTIHDALLNRDPVSGTAYYASLMFFALLPRILVIHFKVS